MFGFTFTTRALIVGAISAVALIPAAQAAQPATEELNPPPPSFLTCKTVGAGTICEGSRQFVKESEEQPELVCGSGADAFTIYDQGDIYQRAIRWYDADGNLTRRIIHERWAPAWWSNPLNGETVPYTQTNTFIAELAVPGDFDTATETIVGETIWTDPDTRKKVLRSVGRQVVGADGTLEFRAGQQAFLDAFVDGDLSVFDAVCAALAS
jgi:hypothetical protein